MHGAVTCSRRQYRRLLLWVFTSGRILCAGLFFLPIVGCAPRQNIAAGRSTTPVDGCPFETPYRAWFFRPPPGSVAGYPRQGATAEQDAHVRIRGYAKMFVRGTLRYFSDGSSDDKQDSVSFYYDASDSQTVRGWKPVDSFFVCCRAYVCLMADGLLSTVDTSAVSACRSSPDGAAGPDADTQFIYGRGAHTLQYYGQASSWMAAEESAIKALCRQSVVHYASLVKMHDTGERTEISRTSRYGMDLVVRNVKIVCRYYDVAATTCTVWAACRKTDIHSWKEH